MHQRREYLEAQKTGKFKVLASKPVETYVRVYDQVAIQRGSTEITVERDGEEQTVKLRYLNVWVLRDRRWQLASRQSAFEPPPEPPPGG